MQTGGETGRVRAPDSSSLQDGAYQARLAAEKNAYERCLAVHNLPPIFHYWSNTHIRPQMEALGFSNPNQLFYMRLQEQCERQKACAPRFVSIGAGNCDLEIEVALTLRSKGYSFLIECVDLNGAMLDRGRTAAANAGVSDQIRTVQADFNEWSPGTEYDAVIANQSLHHVLCLEDLFAKIKASLKPQGCFVISDIIGRNGHQRWPEALEIVHEFWRKLPPSYRFNQQLERYEELYENRACSSESFEGIRSQDILPLLLEHFHFQLFLVFGNVIDPFVDRSFGYNFDATEEWDRAFIDEVHRRDHRELIAGRIKPTHMVAVVGKDSAIPTVFRQPMSPEFCLRPPTPAGNATAVHDAYQWDAWPHSPQRELESVCQRLAAVESQLRDWHKEIAERTAWAQRLEKQFEERTAWALSLEKNVEEWRAMARRLESELEDRTAWALRLREELKQLEWASRFEGRKRRFYQLARRLLFLSGSE